jgi:cell division GTPase FtsZ
MEEFDFVDHYDEAEEVAQSNQLPENEVECALNCAFVGVGGGGGKLAKAFLDLGFKKTLLINTPRQKISQMVLTLNIWF